jgi:phosphotransferase system  glucose/maltose/N-acetylglucosamine-specific IIC component
MIGCIKYKYEIKLMPKWSGGFSETRFVCIGLGFGMIFDFILLFYIVSYNRRVMNILPTNTRRNRYLTE